ncbi:hypothetical protein E2C01_041820 [Portunus trituberculatus]|uniref:Uncharacterized protein n=1 Tax=Portunus trituberculatus TaxID=210409 RepID=A0A5B7FRP7_PORTR|nr:hypothetical protein [Portunus trituberculatus]
MGSSKAKWRVGEILPCMLYTRLVTPTSQSQHRMKITGGLKVISKKSQPMHRPIHETYPSASSQTSYNLRLQPVKALAHQLTK